jgi:hypothetical protein
MYVYYPPFLTPLPLLLIEDSDMSDADDEDLLIEGASLTAIYLSTLSEEKASTLLAAISEADQVR